MIKRTFKQLQEIDQLVVQLYKKDPTLKNGKFSTGYSKFYKKNYLPLLEELQEKIQDNQLEFALVDEKTKELLYGEPDERGNKPYKFSKEGMKSLMEANRKLIKEFDAKEVTVEPYICKDVPKLEKEDEELLKGCIL